MPLFDQEIMVRLAQPSFPSFRIHLVAKYVLTEF
jgi:hypothetical protein